MITMNFIKIIGIMIRIIIVTDTKIIITISNNKTSKERIVIIRVDSQPLSILRSNQRNNKKIIRMKNNKHQI